MATLLGMFSFTDEEVVAQSDTQLLRTTVETLTVEFNQSKYEEFLSSGSFSPKAMRKARKASKETKAPTTAVSHRPSSEGMGSASSKLASRVENPTLAAKPRVLGHKRAIEATSLFSMEDDTAAKALREANKTPLIEEEDPIDECSSKKTDSPINANLAFVSPNAILSFTFLLQNASSAFVCPNMSLAKARQNAAISGIFFSQNAGLKTALPSRSVDLTTM